MLKDTDIKLLYKSLTFLDKLSANEQNLIIKNTKIVKYKRGENIHGGLNTCAGVLIVKKGRLRTYLLSEEGREVTLYLLEPGDICVLSASCVLNNITFDINIDGEKDSEILLVDLEAINSIHENIFVENFLLNQTVSRFSDVMWAIEQILFLKFDQRLAMFLLDETTRNKSDIILQTHEQIAKHLGSAREVVSRMLKYFSEEGFVELSRGEVHVKNKNGIKEIIHL